MQLQQVPPADGLIPEERRQARIRRIAQLLREQVWKFVPPKENKQALNLIDLLESEALHE